MTFPRTVAVLTAGLAIASPAAGRDRAARSEAVPLSFPEMLEPSPQELRPTAKLLSLRGKRVRLVGYMARMESPPRGAFYIAPHPVFCDEAAGSTADLPPEAVRVIVRSAAGQVIPFVPRPLAVTGTLEVGPVPDEEGRVSSIRLVLDRPEDLPRSRRQPPTQPKRKESP